MASPPLLTFGSVGEFDSSTETFTAYFERLEKFFVANNIGQCEADATAAVIAAASKRKVAVMISIIDKSTYGVVRDLCSPENPKEKTFEQFGIYYNSTLNQSDWRSHKFHRCFQEETEGVSYYSARLRHLASTFNFSGF